MRWSFRVARVFGIDVKVHATFFLILILGAYQWGRLHGLPGAVYGATLMALLFLCVTLHELGHSVVAQFFKIPVREIVLLPLGGIAFMERNPRKPLHELLISIAGPAVNVVIAASLLPLLGVSARLTGLDAKGLVEGSLTDLSATGMLLWLFAANITLVIFNLIPAFPLDGGRIFRSVLAFYMDYVRATRIAATVGQAFALLFGLLGILAGNWILVLVAAFVFFGAGAESTHEQSRSVLTTLKVGHAYNKHALTLAPGDRVSRVVDYILTSYQPDFAVMHGGRFLGLITRDDVIRALDLSGEDAFVTGIMERNPLRVDAGLSLEEVIEEMNRAAGRVAAVYHKDQYLGLVSREDIAEALSVISHFKRRRVLDPRAA